MLDCIVVGAGPAGSTAAYHLAKAGRQVLLLEKAALPRYKPCSGAVSPDVAKGFDFDLTPAIDRKLRRVRYTWQLGDAIDAELQTAEPIWMVRREVFDQFLVKQAQRRGAEIKDATPVLGIDFQEDSWAVETADGILNARYIIAADGAAGPMAGWLGFKPHKLSQASILEVEMPESMTDICPMAFEFGLLKGGCLWNFPKRQRYSIGIGKFLGGDLKHSEALLAKYAEALGTGERPGKVYHHGLKLWDGNRPLHTHQALLAGEAAAIVDPLTAEGIRPAVFSGMRAAQAIEQALAGEANALTNYTLAMHAEWGADMQWAQRIAAVFFRVPGIGYRMGIKRPTATQRLGELLAGEIRYGDIAQRVIKRMSSGLILGRDG